MTRGLAFAVSSVLVATMGLGCAIEDDLLSRGLPDEFGADLPSVAFVWVLRVEDCLSCGTQDQTELLRALRRSLGDDLPALVVWTDAGSGEFSAPFEGFRRSQRIAPDRVRFGTDLDWIRQPLPQLLLIRDTEIEWALGPSNDLIDGGQTTPELLRDVVRLLAQGSL